MDDRVAIREYNACTAGASAYTAANGVLKRLQFVLDSYVLDGGAPSNDPTVRMVQSFITLYKSETLHEVEERIVGFADRKFDMDFPE